MDPQTTSKPPPRGKSAVPLMAKWFYAEDFALMASWTFELVYISLALWLTGYGYAVPIMDILVKDPNYFTTKLPTLLRWSPPVLFFGTWATALSKISFYLTPATRGKRRNMADRGALVPDFALAEAPTIVIWRTNIGNTRQKFIIISAMSLGFIAGAIAIAKTVVNAKVQENGDTYGIGVVLVISQAEVSAAIIAACVPFCRPLVRKFASKENSDEETGSRSPESEGR
ncbi:hypothetical protein SMACR_00035 [Sordaria macrospora]|uniref:WGS project CABT00000000 data, contig 2.1 n=2 Tax=Sordaria macrospora TaxID=5147 RepID=F7VJZ2_SORMK|nr:uncharacterized protein SMAC_00035 [Sordaria macrospora k-hell]KAA8629107.1 hypothetical protein SMACR_00035 [Sordaria macrospora]KAH7636114.1 hypothetical protein B0T09DRAFT_354448 [Sordaria sp. MPI-SDFR-AT-0083]WPJ64559.1 hypothetical protein SMAC4_00035 [Sordaria macrospora]CCC05819.1 unnamed protein product [Sordaria macrospora k-hell]